MRRRVLRRRKRLYDPVVPNPRDWPITRFTKDRKRFKQQVVTRIYKYILSHTSNISLVERIESTVHKEKMRIRRQPWSVDPKDDLLFWQRVEQRLIDLSGLDPEKKEAMGQRLLMDIIVRYVDEISGHFRAGHYLAVQPLLFFFFTRLLNTVGLRNIRGLFSKKLILRDKISILGEIEHIRALTKKGTVVLLPTHSSNIDSVVVGWVMREIGLPPFVYGAGLNLFNMKIFAHFMHRLGAYKIDRRRKNLIYLDTIKIYTKEVIKYGCHTLFYPGGTRSRSGVLEKKLKTGLLSTTLSAQRELLQADTEQKLFLVPLVLNYHFVLEAPALVREHLSKQGQERYYTEHDQASTSYKVFKFIIKFFTARSSMCITIGRGMDVLGNEVDEKGQSMDERGRKVDIRDYFTSSDGQLTYDKQRETQYTRMLVEKIAASFKKNTHVLSSHLVAFVAFELIRKRHKHASFYDLFRLDEREVFVEEWLLKNAVRSVRDAVLALSKRGLIRHDKTLHLPLNELIADGVQQCGSYHSARPLRRRSDGKIITQDINCLYFYHNRLSGYGLEQHV